jgi:hypothetical protein
VRSLPDGRVEDKDDVVCPPRALSAHGAPLAERAPSVTVHGQTWLDRSVDLLHLFKE